MLLRHGLQYLLARGLPGVLNFLAIAVYTRLLDPDQYGVYTLVIAAVGVVDALLLHWLRLALLRFMPSEENGGAVALSTILRMFLWLGAGVTALVILGAQMFIAAAPLRWTITLGALVFLSQGAFELTVERERAALSPLGYGRYVGAKSVIGLLAGAGLAAAGMGAAGLLIGLILSMLVPLLAFGGVSQWLPVFRIKHERSMVVAVTRYGLPLAATATLAFVVSSSDRFMLAAFIDEAAAGKYAVGYDLAQFTVGMLLAIVNLAGYPLIVSALEKNGEGAARDVLRLTFSLLMAIGLPATVGIGLLSHNIAEVMVGAEFKEVTALIMPWIAASALIAGLKSFYFDLAFQLSRSTITQLWIVLASALANVGLNAWLIPLYGVLGAVYATLAAYGLALLLSWRLGRSAFPIPGPDRSMFSVLAATLLMTLALIPLRSWLGPSALAVQVGVGAIVYGATLLLVGRGMLKRLAAHGVVQGGNGQ